LFFSFKINYKESDSDDDKNYLQLVEPETNNINMLHTPATPSNIVEDNDGTTNDDDPNIQMSSDSEENFQVVDDDEYNPNVQISSDSEENYQVVDDNEYDANSDFNIDISSENLRVADENDCVQNVPIYHENQAHRAQVYIF